VPSQPQPFTDQPELRLQALIAGAVDTAKKARKHRASLTGVNFYADKLAALRADATNRFAELGDPSVGDLSAVAEMVEHVFSPDTEYPQRVKFSRELLHELKTKRWKSAVPSDLQSDDGLFPLSLLVKTRRGYLVVVGRQANACYAAGWYDACAVMMRRLLETSIVEAFESKGIAPHIKNAQGEFVALSELIQRALAETTWNLSRNTKKALPNLRDVGHISAHSRRFTAQKSDISKVQQDFRIALEEFLHLANLL
jgi:hypothetical protein